MTIAATHQFRLHPGPFGLIARGEKVIEARINDEKRQQITIGDEIEFISRADGGVVRVRVVRLLLYPTFRELFSARYIWLFGGQDIDESVEAMRAYYSSDDEQKFGVVGIEFELL